MVRKRKCEMGIEEQYKRAKNRLTIYVVFSCLLVIFAVIGYISGLSTTPAPKGVHLIMFNFGTYGILGIGFSYAIVLCILSIVVLIGLIRDLGLTLFGFLFSILGVALFFGIGVAILEGVIYLVDGVIKWSKIETILDTYVQLSKTIPGPSETVGTALATSVLYDVPFIICVIKAIKWGKDCRKLKEPAAEAKTIREEKEQKQAEEEAQQERARREAREKEKRARAEWKRKEQEAWERYKREQQRMQKKDDFYFFENCSTREQVDARYKALMRAYHPDTKSGDEEMAKIINEQYDEAKKQFDDEARTDKDTSTIPEN